MIEHMEPEVVDFDLPDMEKFLFAFSLLCAPVDAEYSGETFSCRVTVSPVRTVFKYKVHETVADKCLVKMYAALPEQPVHGKFGNYVLGFEKGVHLSSCAWAGDRTFVDDKGVFQDKSGEWLEVDLLEGDVSLNVFCHRPYHLFGYESLHLWQLYRKRNREYNRQYGHNGQPEYFQRPFYDFIFLNLQLAKIVKISDKIRIFAVGFNAYCMP